MNAPWGYLTYALERQPRGIGRYTQALLAALCRLGWAPLVLQAGGWPPHSKEAFPVRQLHLRRLRGAGLLPALLTLGQVQIAWLARREGLALLHDPTGTLPLLLSAARHVATIHDAIPYLYPAASAALDRLVQHAWLPVAVRRIAGVITVSAQSKRDLLRYLPMTENQITVIPGAAGGHFRRLAEAEIAPVLQCLGVARPYILYVGSLEPRKNLLRLLEAYQRLLPWARRWRLVIAGARNAWKSSPLAEAVARLGLAQQVHFTGYVADEHLPALYNGADLFCFPSLYEGFGLPVLEAMACGAPVVCANTSSLPEVAGDAALLVDPCCVDEIASAIHRVLSEPALAESLHQRGLARAQRFSWEETARQTIEVYQRVLQR